MSIYEKIRLSIHEYTQIYNSCPQIILMTRKTYNLLYNEMYGNQKIRINKMW